MKGEKVVIRELDGGRGTDHGGVVIDSGIGVPSLSGVLEMILETAPLVPFESAVGKDEEDDDNNEDDGSDFCYLNNVMTEIVDDRGVNLIAESDGGLLRDREDGLIEGDVVEGIGDLLLCQLEGGVEAREWIRKRAGWKKRRPTEH